MHSGVGHAHVHARMSVTWSGFDGPDSGDTGAVIALAGRGAEPQGPARAHEPATQPPTAATTAPGQARKARIAYVTQARETRQTHLAASGPTTSHAGHEAAIGTPDLLELALNDAIRGRERSCRARAERALALPRAAADAQVKVSALSTLGLLELSLGNARAAAEHLRRCADLASAQAPDHGALFAFEPDHVEALLMLGRKNDARQVAKTQQQHADRCGKPAALAAAARCRGLLADTSEFEREFEAALKLHDLAPSVFDRARTQLCYGEQLRRSGRRSRARRHLASALATFQRIQATPWAQRADREFQAASTTTRARHDPATNDRLTPQELRVATIMADGATIRQAAAQLFLSPKTIEAHLGRAYRKLGVRNRAQLATKIAHDQGTDR